MEYVQRIVFFEVIVLEVLDDDESEEIEHDPCADEQKHHEVDCCEGYIYSSFHTTSFHAIVHHPFPILSSARPVESEQSQSEVLEVIVVGDVLAKWGSLEEEHPKDGEYEEHEEQERTDVHQRW